MVLYHLPYAYGWLDHSNFNRISRFIFDSDQKSEEIFAEEKNQDLIGMTSQINAHYPNILGWGKKTQNKPFLNFHKKSCLGLSLMILQEKDQ